jgi:acetyl esterase/lipase
MVAYFPLFDSLWRCPVKMHVSIVIFVLFLLAGAATPSYCLEMKDVEYGKAGTARLLLDVYTPDDEKARHPAVVLIHGGAFRGGDKSTYRGLAEVLVKQGFVVFSVNYRLAPKYPYPAGLDDVQRAVRWIRAQAPRYTVDPGHIGAIGHSAGGYYAAMLAMRDTRSHEVKELAGFSSKVTCAADFFGPADFCADLGSAHGTKVIDEFLGMVKKGNEPRWKEASPITYVSKSCAPLYIFHGSKDPLVPVSQSRALYEALKKAKAPAWYMELEGAGHGWRPQSPAGVRSNKALAEFLEEHLK